MSVLNGFLRGIKVLDLAHYLPGPIASLFFADMGADVIKIVPPGGDGMKLLGPRDASGAPIFHDAVNAGKRELTLDLKQPQDKAVFQTLVDAADVLLEGFRPGTLARLGFDPVQLRSRNPKLVICSISGYGAEGPLAQAAGHDANFLAASGLMARNTIGLFDPPIVDAAAALFAAVTILGALHKRSNTGEGCIIDIGLADVMMPLQLFHISAYARAGWMPQPDTYYLNGGLACYHDYCCADGRRLILGALENKFWRAFCTAAQRPDWIARHADPEPQLDLIEEVRGFFGSLSMQECLHRFAGVDCCLTPVVDMEEAVASPHFANRGLLCRREGDLQALFPAHVDGLPPQRRESLTRIGADEALSSFSSATAP